MIDGYLAGVFSVLLCRDFFRILRAARYVLVATLLTLIGVCLLRVVWVALIVPDGHWVES